MDIPHTDRFALKRQYAEVARRLSDAYVIFQGKCVPHLSARDFAMIGEKCGYHAWLEETGKARYGVDNRLTSGAVLGATQRLRKDGTIGPFFRFLHVKEAEFMEELGVATDNPYRQELASILEEAMALPPLPHSRSRA